MATVFMRLVDIRKDAVNGDLYEFQYEPPPIDEVQRKNDALFKTLDPSYKTPGPRVKVKTT